MHSVGHDGHDHQHQVADAPLPPGQDLDGNHWRIAGGNSCVGHASYDFHRQIVDAFLSRARRGALPREPSPGNLSLSQNTAANSQWDRARGSLGVVHDAGETHGTTDGANTFAQSKESTLSRIRSTEHFFPRPIDRRHPHTARRGILRRLHIRLARWSCSIRVGESLAALQARPDCQSRYSARAA